MFHIPNYNPKYLDINYLNITVFFQCLLLHPMLMFVLEFWLAILSIRLKMVKPDAVIF